MKRRKKPLGCLVAGFVILALNHLCWILDSSSLAVLPVLGMVCVVSGTHGVFDPRSFELGMKRYAFSPGIMVIRFLWIVLGVFLAWCLLKFGYGISLFS